MRWIRWMLLMFHWNSIVCSGSAQSHIENLRARTNGKIDPESLEIFLNDEPTPVTNEMNSDGDVEEIVEKLLSQSIATTTVGVPRDTAYASDDSLYLDVEKIGRNLVTKLGPLTDEGAELVDVEKESNGTLKEMSENQVLDQSHVVTEISVQETIDGRTIQRKPTEDELRLIQNTILTSYNESEKSNDIFTKESSTSNIISVVNQKKPDQIEDLASFMGMDGYYDDHDDNSELFDEWSDDVHDMELIMRDEEKEQNKEGKVPDYRKFFHRERQNFSNVQEVKIVISETEGDFFDEDEDPFSGDHAPVRETTTNLYDVIEKKLQPSLSVTRVSETTTDSTNYSTTGESTSGSISTGEAPTNNVINVEGTTHTIEVSQTTLPITTTVIPTQSYVTIPDDISTMKIILETSNFEGTTYTPITTQPTTKMPLENKNVEAITHEVEVLQTISTSFTTEPQDGTISITDITNVEESTVRISQSTTSPMVTESQDNTISTTHTVELSQTTSFPITTEPQDVTPSIKDTTSAEETTHIVEVSQTTSSLITTESQDDTPSIKDTTNVEETTHTVETSQTTSSSITTEPQDDTPSINVEETTYIVEVSQTTSSPIITQPRIKIPSENSSVEDTTHTVEVPQITSSLTTTQAYDDISTMKLPSETITEPMMKIYTTTGHFRTTLTTDEIQLTDETTGAHDDATKATETGDNPDEDYFLIYGVAHDLTEEEIEYILPNTSSFVQSDPILRANVLGNHAEFGVKIIKKDEFCLPASAYIKEASVNDHWLVNITWRANESLNNSVALEISENGIEFTIENIIVNIFAGNQTIMQKKRVQLKPDSIQEVPGKKRVAMMRDGTFVIFSNLDFLMKPGLNKANESAEASRNDTLWQLKFFSVALATVIVILIVFYVITIKSRTKITLSDKDELPQVTHC